MQIVIVGSGNNYEELKNKAKGHDNIIFTGARTDVDKILNVADLFVGVSRAALEAMACEIPVILVGNETYGQGYQGVFDENTLEFAMETNFTCRGLEKIDKNKLKNDILQTLASESKEKMGKYNRNIVKEFYSIEKMAEDALKIYKS